MDSTLEATGLILVDKSHEILQYCRAADLEKAKLVEMLASTCRETIEEIERNSVGGFNVPLPLLQQPKAVVNA